MTIQRIHPGNRLCDATIHNGVAYLAGQIPEDASLPIAAQTQSVLDQIDSVLALAGSDKSRILSATIYLSSMGDFAAMNAVYAEFFTEGQYPARSAVEVGALPRGALVEIETICVK